ncbi:MAG: redoxin family protein [Woeseiaceae bacterium]
MKLSIAVIIIVSFFAGPPANAAKPAPEFTQQAAEDWLNSPPLTLASLKGKVVLIDFWTFACWNCYRSFPWLNTLEAQFEGKPFQVIGVHSPEFEYEKDRESVALQIEKFGLKHPVMIDNAHRYWKAIGNRYWPAFYLIDQEGKIQEVFIGETHTGSKQARRIESAIEKLLLKQ